MNLIFVHFLLKYFGYIYLDLQDVLVIFVVGFYLNVLWVLLASLSTIEDTGIQVKGWNCSVQKFFLHHVFRRLPRNILSHGLRQVIVMLVSAWWHGLSPLIYITMLSLPIIQMPQQIAWDLQLPLLEHPIGKHVHKVLRIIYCQNAMTFMVLPHALQLGVSGAIHVWSSVYYFPFVCSAIYIILPFFFKKKKDTNKTHTHTQGTHTHKQTENKMHEE
eukprot:GHVR01141516.1.p2 GENE.GHVR01141516.1~~GHVR01141516.1.p2  ORF type:complete len:217 (+),score=33.41 GHVR01141516.1:627-1277(+)